jgi:hypothetical protein
MRRFSFISLQCVLLLVVMAGTQSAQAQAVGSIVGVVTDQTGAVVVNAAVSSTSFSTNAQSSTTTDGAGRYVIGSLNPGRYRLEISATGFGVFRHDNVIVEVGRSTTIEATLKPAATESTVTTTAEAPVVETDRSDFTTNINAATMDNAPVNARRWSTFALTTPGAQADGTFGLISFRGISGLLNENTVDGGSNTQAFFAEEKGRTRISYSMSASSIQEFQVSTSNYSAEFGRAAGGVVNAVTKSGTNHLHGEAYWYYRDSDIGATNPFATQTILVNGINTTVPIKPPDRRHQFGGNIGGTIIKDKLFFFFNADQQFRNFPGVASASDPAGFVNPLSTAEKATLNGRGITDAQAASGQSFLQTLTGQVARKGDELVLFPKLDWNITNKHHASVEYNRMRWSSPAGVQTASVVFRGIESFGDDGVKVDTLVARLSSTLNARMVNELRFSYGRDFEFQQGQASIAGEPVSQFGVSPQITINGASSPAVGSTPAFGSAFVFGKPNFLDRTSFPDERRSQFADTVSISRGKHLLKFGADINHVYDIMDNLFQNAGAYVYTDRVAFISDYVAATTNHAPFCAGSGCYSSYNQGFGPTAFDFTTWDMGFFFNDDWRATPRLTINLGMRYDYERLPSPQIPNLPKLPATAQFANDTGNIAHRLGFAWNIQGNGKTVLRGGYGVYYGRIINSTISNAITNTGNTAGQLQFQFSSPTAANAPVYPNVVPTAPPPAATPPDVVVFAHNTQVPDVHQFDLVFEKEIFTNTAVTVSYLGSLGRHLPIFIDTNLPPPASTITYKVFGGPSDGQSFTMPLFTGPRPNTQFGRITNISDTVDSNYNAVAFQFTRRMTHGLQVQAQYTYSHANDNGQSSTTFTSANNVLNPYDLGLERGRSIFDVRNHFAASTIWQPEIVHSDNRIAKLLANGFTFSPTFSAFSGFPYTGFVSGNAPPAGISTGILRAGGSARVPFEPRDGFESPGSFNIDFRVGKKFAVTERASFELLTDFFNLLNRINPTSLNGMSGGSGSEYIIRNCPTALLPACGTYTGPALAYQSNFGTTNNTSSTLGGPGQRQIQIGARLTW